MNEHTYTSRHQSRLEGYVVFKNCFQVPIDWENDEALERDLVRARLTELG